MEKRSDNATFHHMWVERHTFLSDILVMYPYIKAALTRLSEPDHDTKTITEVTGLLSFMSQPQFIVAFIISEHILSSIALSFKVSNWLRRQGFIIFFLKSSFPRVAELI